VFFGGGFGSYEVHAVDARSGAPVWTFGTRDDGPTAVVASAGVVTFNTESCTVHVVDARDGRPLWEKWLGDPLLAQPAVCADRVIMAFPRGGEHWLAAFDLASGQCRWETAITHDVITAPVVAGGLVYISTFDGCVWSLDASDGRILWTRAMNATSAPWVYRGDVYVARRSGEAAAPQEQTTAWDAHAGDLRSEFRQKESPYLSKRWGAARKTASVRADADVGFAQAPAAAKLGSVTRLIGEHGVERTWRFQGSRPVVVDGVLYETTGDRLEACDAMSGARLWSWSAARSVDGERRLTPPAVAGDRVLAGTWDGRILAWRASDGSVLWNVNVGAPCHWQPVMVGGWVYAGLEGGSVVAFDTKDAACDGWPMWGGGVGHNGWTG
jgi:outer membrane protein assembly factor BamB